MDSRRSQSFQELLEILHGGRSSQYFWKLHKSGRCFPSVLRASRKLSNLPTGSRNFSAILEPNLPCSSRKYFSIVHYRGGWFFFSFGIRKFSEGLRFSHFSDLLKRARKFLVVLRHISWYFPEVFGTSQKCLKFISSSRNFVAIARVSQKC